MYVVVAYGVYGIASCLLYAFSKLFKNLKKFERLGVERIAEVLKWRTASIIKIRSIVSNYNKRLLALLRDTVTVLSKTIMYNLQLSTTYFCTPVWGFTTVQINEQCYMFYEHRYR